jgi:hypothetical protein
MSDFVWVAKTRHPYEVSALEFVKCYVGDRLKALNRARLIKRLATLLGSAVNEPSS